MLYLAIGLAVLLVATSIVAIAAVFAVGWLHGQQRMLNKQAVESKRRERRQQRTVELWQTKALERAGLGPLKRQPVPTNHETKPARRFVTPSEAVGEMRKEDRFGKAPKSSTRQVPPAISDGFLKDVGESLQVN